MTTATPFWKNMYYGKWAGFVLILSQEASKQLGSSVVRGDDPAKVGIPSVNNINLGIGHAVNEAIVIEGVHVYGHN